VIYNPRGWGDERLLMRTKQGTGRKDASLHRRLGLKVKKKITLLCPRKPGKEQDGEKMGGQGSEGIR